MKIHIATNSCPIRHAVIASHTAHTYGKDLFDGAICHGHAAADTGVIDTLSLSRLRHYVVRQ